MHYLAPIFRAASVTFLGARPPAIGARKAAGAAPSTRNNCRRAAITRSYVAEARQLPATFCSAQGSFDLPPACVAAQKSSGKAAECDAEHAAETVANAAMVAAMAVVGKFAPGRTFATASSRSIVAELLAE